MLRRIGLLLPRSTDYPSIGYDILDGLRLGLKSAGQEDVQFFFDNIGFGENASDNYARAEKICLAHDPDVLIVYAGSVNAEYLYPLAEALSKPILFVDAGMQFPTVPPSPWCYHISLQGIHACYHMGQHAGRGNKRVLMATSFYDGGYRGTMYTHHGVSETGGSLCGNFVSGYKVADFTIEPYLNLLQEQQPQAIAANFSTYLSELFFKALHENKDHAVAAPFFCSPFMAEEQILGKCPFPGGEFTAIVSWASSLDNEAQREFKATIEKEKGKPANVFHLLGWEAAIVAQQIGSNGPRSLDDFEYDSPRGHVVMDKKTHYTYAPLYRGVITGDDEGKCVLQVEGSIDVTRDEHHRIVVNQDLEFLSGWKNNYFCI